VAVSFSESTSYFKKKSLLTGNFIREEFFQVAQSNRNNNQKKILIFGGSIGARSINLKMVSVAKLLGDIKEDISIVHLTGNSEDTERLKIAYANSGIKATVQEYSFEIPNLYFDSDFVISRAGATTISELIALQKPAILIPYPHAGGHQRLNAKILTQIGAAKVIEESSSDSNFSNLIHEMFKDETREKMRQSYFHLNMDLKIAPQLLLNAIVNDFSKTHG
jgi:UDP-N-acetylglucosamine--N-acetylmuramyl-(pentapeptide) pyrophosphoryl-undecaprenol N-acetylglucosamine transferase